MNALRRAAVALLFASSVPAASAPPAAATGPNTENSWTVQYAERNHGRPRFAEGAGRALIRTLAPAVIPAADNPR